MQVVNTASATAHATLSHTQAPHLIRGPKVFGPNGRTGMSRTAWYHAVLHGTAPKPVRIGTRAVAWRSQDIDAFIATRQVKS